MKYGHEKRIAHFMHDFWTTITKRCTTIHFQRSIYFRKLNFFHIPKLAAGNIDFKISQFIECYEIFRNIWKLHTVLDENSGGRKIQLSVLTIPVRNVTNVYPPYPALRIPFTLQVYDLYAFTIITIYNVLLIIIWLMMLHPFSYYIWEVVLFANKFYESQSYFLCVFSFCKKLILVNC